MTEIFKKAERYFLLHNILGIEKCTHCLDPSSNKVNPYRKICNNLTTYMSSQDSNSKVLNRNISNIKKGPEFKEVDILNGTKVNDFYFQLYMMILSI